MASRGEGGLGKTGWRLDTIRPKPTKEVLNVQRALCKEASALIAPMGTKEFCLKKYSRTQRSYQALTHWSAPAREGCNPQNIR